MQFLKTLEELKATTLINSKKQILLKNQEDKDLLYVLERCYNPIPNYFITGKKIGKADFLVISENGFDMYRFKQLLIRLEKREVTGNKALDEVIEFMMFSPMETHQFIINFFNRDLRAGINESLILKVFPDLFPSYNMMKGDSLLETKTKQWDEKKLSKLKYPMLADYKLNGIRATYWKGELRTFNGKLINGFNLLKHELLILTSGNEEMIVDMELTNGEPNHPKSLQRMMNVLNKDDEKVKEKVIAYIFDILESDKDVSNQFERRTGMLASFSLRQQQIGRQFEFLKPIQFRYIHSQEEMTEMFEKLIKDGYEGLMLKSDKPYEFKRSKNWIKVKKFDNLDLVIVGFNEGTGKFEGKLGSLIVDYEGKKVAVSGFSDKQRKEMWAIKEELIGKTAEIAYRTVTPDGSLEFPLFKMIREDK